MSGNPRVIGALVVGIALISGAYVLSGFGEPPKQPAAAADAIQKAPVRTAITVLDENNDGLEDWRNALTINNPITLTTAPTVSGSGVVASTTLSTGFSVNFFEKMLQSQMYGDFGSSEDEVIRKAVIEAGQKASDVLYDQRDIIIIPDNNIAIRAYGNRAANILTENDVPDSENEAAILKKAIERQDETILERLAPRAEAYANMRDGYLNTPVPQKLVKRHLDIINSLHAIHNDIAGMQQAFADPLRTLIRLKRYQDDATGLTFSLANMYAALAETPEVFEPNDSALLFLAFAPVNTTN